MDMIERIQGVIDGQPLDRLPAQPMLMMFAAKNAGMSYLEYTRDGRNMAEAQLRLWKDYGVDCLLTCSDPAREVIDIAGEGSIDWKGCQNRFMRQPGDVTSFAGATTLSAPAAKCRRSLRRKICAPCSPMPGKTNL